MEEQGFTTIQTQTENRIFYISLNRPEKRNALNSDMISELKEVLKEVDKSDNEAKVIILRGNGKAFSAGADLESLQKLQNYSYSDNLQDSNHLKELFQLIYYHSKPIIAQVEGHAIAGGCGLATVCDFIFSVPEAKFGYTEVKIGFIPAIVMVFLLRKIGETKARELLLTGTLKKAAEMSDVGLINQICEPEAIAEEVKSFATQIADNTSAQAVALTKEMIAEIQSMHVKDAINYAAENNAKARSFEDCQKGIEAFLNKEELKW